MTIKIVVDTSVFISALIGSSGPSRQILRCSLQRQFSPLMSNALFCEYESVIHRDSILAQCPLSQSDILTLTQAFMSVCIWTDIFYLWRPNLRDEADNHLIELAIAGNANVLVTNNLKDFRNAQLSFPHLKILSPTELIRS
ncbi:MAG: putative toxin-antitoxin system toxin component, PIN family [Leptolyngbyaceae cyanobacterium SU_3_3]|nr:putative toxin-antitoxin system toxin component, PIN family [Leptolyngbyaceae cyanobacterium SU_3_3]